MGTKAELWALAAVALAMTPGTSASGAEGLDVPERESSTENESRVNFNDIWPQAIAKAWVDESFKRELLENPARALKTYFNYDVPPDIQLHILEKEPGRPAPVILSLPEKPAFVDIMDPAARERAARLFSEPC